MRVNSDIEGLLGDDDFEAHDDSTKDLDRNEEADAIPSGEDIEDVSIQNQGNGSEDSQMPHYLAEVIELT
ncbi:hypothetical protein C1H76_7224 [Elsinoe australis]|uniref:Uncharacterized protein n=1 Tax=Elsinoe australis TaxID=40998 RepID=A0A4U7AXG7_9PEZI|nr:hypothetical protein C1H76_7224 [Elsinoe australis]